MNLQSYKGQVIWIIGASSGIGAALARELASSGATLVLSARRKDALEQLQVELGGAEHKVFTLDIADTDMTLRTAKAIHAAMGRIDRVVFLAATYAPMKLDKLDISVTRKLIDVNLMGAFNLIHAVIPLLALQVHKSQIALCGSVAGYIGLPKGQPYSATKAAIINLAESLHAECNDKIDIKLISPGFVRTELTDKNDFDMPMIINPEQAAQAISDGLLSRSFEIHFPKKFTFILKLIRLLPYWLLLRLTTKIKT
jgi:short-subunit dehydrogenase